MCNFFQSYMCGVSKVNNCASNDLDLPLFCKI